jgi:acyl-CoA thioesterase-1
MSKFIIAAFALLLCGAGSSLSYADKRLLVVGDSLSAAYGLAVNAGWVALLGDHLEQRGTSIEVINASISGDTTQGGLARLPALLQAYEPAVVIIELGANDGLQGFPLQSMTDNLQQMIRQSKRSGARVLLVGMRIPPNYGTKYTAIFFHSYQQLAQQEHIALVPFLLEGIATEEGMMQADGLHPTAAAQATLLQTILAELLPLLDEASGTGGPAL